jgi:hypothetical protein
MMQVTDSGGYISGKGRTRCDKDDINAWVWSKREDRGWDGSLTSTTIFPMPCWTLFDVDSTAILYKEDALLLELC